MQLTDDEIRAVLARRKKELKKRKRARRRIGFLLILILVLVVGIGIYINRDAMVTARGIIFIDAGHGGVDGGSVVGKRLEKDDTLRLALAVREDLEDMGFKVCMSRTKDEDVDRAERGKMANKKKAQLFLSIHRNKATEGKGVEVYIPAKNDTNSQILGNNIFKALIGQGFTERSIRRGTLVSEKEDYLENSVPTMPSCLAEIGFMQNSADNKLFDENLESNAEAIAAALENTFSQIYEKDISSEE